MGVDLAPEIPPVLSPELVLVSSPEEIRDALALLPEEPWRIAPAASPQQRAAVLAPAPAHVRRNTLRASGLVALAIVGLTIGYLVGTRSADDGSASSGVLRPPAVVRASAPAPATSVASAQRQQSRKTRSRNASATPAAPSRRSQPRRVPVPAVRAKPTSTAPTKTKTPARTKPAAPTLRGFVPSRTWAWAPTTGAEAYEVTFFKGPKAVLLMRATQPHIVLPRSFRFEPGTYRWTVAALPAVAGARAIVDSTFSVTSAGAAAANKAAADGSPS